jgi:hypothetical protein
LKIILDLNLKKMRTIQQGVNRYTLRNGRLPDGGGPPLSPVVKTLILRRQGIMTGIQRKRKAIIGVILGNIAGLTPGTIYHYRIRSQTTAGIVYGADKTFTTTK